MAATLGVTLAHWLSGLAPRETQQSLVLVRGAFMGSHKFTFFAPSAQNEEPSGLVGASWIAHYAYGIRHNSKAVRHEEVGN